MRRHSDEAGVATVAVVLALPMILLLCAFVVDVGHWFVHKRHLQTQADAAALAGGGMYTFPSCDDAAITSAALRYSGKGDGSIAYNDRSPAIPAERLHAVVNGPSFHGQDGPDEADLAGGPSPCEAKLVDVKMTETDLPWFFGTGLVPNINAEARVKLFQVSEAEGLLPLGVQEAAPRKVRAFVVNEADGTTVKNAAGEDASVVLDAKGSSDGLLRFDNEGAPLAFTPPAGVTNLGVRLALGGGTSTTCGDPLVSCIDSAATNQGLSYLRTWADGNDPATGQPPVARSVALSPVTCTNGSFSSAANACTIDVTAQVKWNPAVTATNVAAGTKLTVKYNGASIPMTYAPGTGGAAGTWTASGVTVPAGTTGPRAVSIDWEQYVGTVGGNTCKTGGGNKCTGTFASVQRTFWNNAEDQGSRGGPVARLDVQQGLGGPLVSDLRRCSATYATCQVDLVFDVGIKGALGLDEADDPPRSLRVAGSGSQNQTLDCDPTKDFVDEIAYGCEPGYAINPGVSCTPASTPLNCVPVQTGTAANKPAKGLNTRFLCDPPGNPGGCKGSRGDWDGKPDTCPAAGAYGHNNWPDYPAGDPRIVPVFLVPFGTFESNGGELVPIIDFAAFYVTGWASNGAGFANPCIGEGDEFVPGTDGDSGVISGHFIKNVTPNDGGTGVETCDFDDVGQCVAVLVK